MTSHGPRKRVIAILRQRCPRCLEGRPFRGLMTMGAACPACGLVFEREPGYFVGAMYVSYALAIPAYLLIVGLLQLLLPGLGDLTVLAAGLPILCLCAPLLFRYSRIIWMHVDRTIDPDER